VSTAVHLSLAAIHTLPPYRPQPGIMPPYFVDRETTEDQCGLVASALESLEAGPDDPRWHRLVVAEPSLGRSAALEVIAGRASRRLGWAAVCHRCRPGQRPLAALADLAAGAVSVTAARWPDSPLGLVGRRGARGGGPGEVMGGTLRWGGGQSGGSGRTALGEGTVEGGTVAGLLALLESAGDRARRAGRGIILLVDDLQALAGPDLECLLAVLAGLGRGRSPVAFVGTSDGEAARRLAAHPGADRLWRSTLGPLDPSESREAVVVPAAERGVSIDEEAVSILIEAAGGSPLSLQRLAYGAWMAAGGAGRITSRDVRLAVRSPGTAGRSDGRGEVAPGPGGDVPPTAA
jgi:hypothetical protein